MSDLLSRQSTPHDHAQAGYLDFINYFFQPPPGLGRHVTARYGILISKVTGKVFLLTLKLFFLVYSCVWQLLGGKDTAVSTPSLGLSFSGSRTTCQLCGAEKRRGLVPCEPPSYYTHLHISSHMAVCMCHIQLLSTANRFWHGPACVGLFSQSSCPCSGCH